MSKKYSEEFKISTATQRSEAWYKKRAGIPSASGLGFLFDTLKDGYTPSAKARKYLRQLAYEKYFGITHDSFVTKPMADGIFYEDFAKAVYKKDTGNKLVEAFSYISDWFVATPDAIVVDKSGKRGLLECKVVGDETFMKLIEDGTPVEHELQVQGQMMASGYNWVDYIVVNLKTKSYFMKRIKRNNKLIERIYERLHEPLDLPELKDVGVKRFDENLLNDFMGATPGEEKIIIEDLGF